MKPADTTAPAAAKAAEPAAAPPSTPDAPPARTLLMGIVNVTPDSFSDGGRFSTPQAACEQALRLLADGADVLDLGAESTRPQATAVSAEEEWARLQPVLEKLRPLTEAPLSIDTYKAAVAAQALACGADWINDIWGLQHDQGQMADTIARHRAAVVIMHNRKDADYREDLIESILTFWQRSLERALSAGIDARRIAFDPGIGFGKTVAHNWDVLRRFEQLRAIGPYPLLLGTSRKSFIGKALNLPVNDRDSATLATSVIGVQKGASILRVHAVRPHVQAIATTEKILPEHFPYADTTHLLRRNAAGKA